MDSTSITNDDHALTHTNVTLEVEAPERLVLDSFFELPMPQEVGRAAGGSMPFVSDHSDIQKYLERPVRIATYAWDISSAVAAYYDPWSLFFAQSSVKSKISGYARIRANMVLKFVVNGTPMHYGGLRVGYRPHPTVSATDDSVFNATNAVGMSNNSTVSKMIASQLIGFTINPAFCANMEMVLPYMSPYSGFEIGGIFNTFANMGQLQLVPYGVLRHANGGTTGVSIEIYAALRDIVMDVPTAVTQGYTLEEAAKVIQKVIRASSKATSMAHEWAPRVMTAAGLLGFSRPLQEPEMVGTRPLPFALANYDRPDSAEPLSLSAASELTLGGQELGANGEDELLVNSIAGKSCFVLGSAWSTSNTVGEWMFGSFVTPMQGSTGLYTKPPNTGKTYSPVTSFTPSPSCFVASCAEFWRGDVVFRISVHASPYHKGRLRVYFEPNMAYDPLVSPPINNVNSVVLDLAETNTVELVVPWRNVRDMLYTGPLRDQATHISTSFTAMRLARLAEGKQSANGYIVCEVLSRLTSMDASVATVGVIVESFCRDLALYSPNLPEIVEGRGLTIDSTATAWVPQSFDVSGADCFASMRQLAKRYTAEHHFQVVAPSAATTGFSAYSTCVATLKLPMYLPPPGLYPDSGALNQYTTSTGLSAFTDPVNYNTFGFRGYLATAFCMMRGAIRWKMYHAFTAVSGINPCFSMVTRSSTSLPAISTTGNRWTFVGCNALFDSASASMIRRTINFRGLTLAQSTAVDSSAGAQTCPVPVDRTPAIKDVQIPYTGALRAVNPRAIIGASSVTASGYSNVLMGMEVPVASNMNISGIIYAAVGEDWNLYGFVHTPTLLDGHMTIT